MLRSGRRLATAAVCLPAALALVSSAAALTPDTALARSLKADMQAYYAKSAPGLKLTTVTCAIGRAGTTARCNAHFTFASEHEVGVFVVSAKINRKTGGVQTKTLSAACRSARTGKPVRC